MGPLAGAVVDRRDSRIGTLGAEGVVRAPLSGTLSWASALFPVVVTSAYWLGLLINAMILGLSAISIGFLPGNAGS